MRFDSRFTGSDSLAIDRRAEEIALAYFGGESFDMTIEVRSDLETWQTDEPILWVAEVEARRVPPDGFVPKRGLES